jgi:hypothetical protein
MVTCVVILSHHFTQSSLCEGPRRSTPFRHRDAKPVTATPLSAILMNLPASVAKKRLTAGLTSLAATLTKNRGGGGPAFRPSDIPAFRRFTLFRTLLRSAKTQPVSYQAIPNSFAKYPGGGALPTFQRSNVQTFQRPTIPRLSPHFRTQYNSFLAHRGENRHGHC